MNKELFNFYKSKGKFKSGEAVYLIDMVDDDFISLINDRKKILADISAVLSRRDTKEVHDLHLLENDLNRIDEQLKYKHSSLLELTRSPRFKEWMKEKNCNSVEEMLSKLKIESWESDLEVEIEEYPLVMSFNNTDIQ